MEQAGVASNARLPAQARVPALLALAIPCIAGLGFLALFGAPKSMLAVNAGALALGLAWVLFGRELRSLRRLRILAVLGLVLLAAPLVIGPHINGIARWIPLGPFQLHAGSLVIPILACLAACDREYGPPLLLAGGLVCLLQPDAASAFALTGAATGLYFAWKDWKPGMAAMLLFLAGLMASTRGNLAPQPFVERVLVDVFLVNLPVAIGLFAAVLASFALMLGMIRQPAPVRYALCGTLAGFSILAVLADYPSILIGYGASPILGFALALGIDWRKQQATDQTPQRI